MTDEEIEQMFDLDIDPDYQDESFRDQAIQNCREFLGETNDKKE